MRVHDGVVYYFEVVTAEVEKTRDAFAETFGWNFEGPLPELGNAFVAKLPSGARCGIRGPLRDDETPIVRNYISVPDVEAAIKRAEKAGAVIALEATEIPGHGKIAIFLVGGIEQGIWELP